MICFNYFSNYIFVEWNCKCCPKRTGLRFVTHRRHHSRARLYGFTVRSIYRVIHSGKRSTILHPSMKSILVTTKLCNYRYWVLLPLSLLHGRLSMTKRKLTELLLLDNKKMGTLISLLIPIHPAKNRQCRVLMSSPLVNTHNYNFCCIVNVSSMPTVC